MEKECNIEEECKKKAEEKSSALYYNQTHTNYFLIPYFLLNRSTLPVASSNFCLPV